jgi:hypothetical protein
VSTATALFSLVRRKKKEERAEADSEVGCLTRIIKEQHTNPRHASSQSTLKAMHQSHILKMRRSVTRCVVIRENGKGGGSPVGLSHTEAAIFKRIGVGAGLADLFLLSQGKLYGLELKPECGRLSATKPTAHDILRQAGTSTQPSGSTRKSGNSNPGGC